MKKGLEYLKKIQMILLFIVIVFTMVGMFIDLKSASDRPAAIIIVVALLHAITMVTGMIYFVEDSRKDVAGYYKAFVILLIISYIGRVVAFIVMKEMSYITVVLSAIILVGGIILAFVKNLGLKITTAVFIIMLACEIAIFVLAMTSESDMGFASSKVAELLITGTLGLMITSKYIDKAERGRKI